MPVGPSSSRVVHGPGTDDPLLGLWRDGFNPPTLLLWITDGQGRQFAVADSNGTDPAQLGMDDSGITAYWGIQDPMERLEAQMRIASLGGLMDQGRIYLNGLIINLDLLDPTMGALASLLAHEYGHMIYEWFGDGVDRHRPGYECHNERRADGYAYRATGRPTVSPYSGC